MKRDYSLIDLSNIIDKENEDIKKYFSYNGIKKFDSNDIESLKKLAKQLNNKSDFNVSYNIYRLDKEFDLIKCGDNIIVNIELKRSNADLNQCKSNYNLLKRFYKRKAVYVFCYVSKANKVYWYNNKTGYLIEKSIEDLNLILDTITDGKIININFKVDSVYMKPAFFINGEYELSRGQATAKDKITNYSFSLKTLLVNGRAGTGKTVLALDIYSHYKGQGYDVVFLTPFKLGTIVDLALRNYINMMTVKNLIAYGIKYDYIIVDEAQRLSQDDINRLIDLSNIGVIMFGDTNQNLDSESAFNNSVLLNGCISIDSIVRTDDTFEIYAKKILNKELEKKSRREINPQRISIYMYNSREIPDLSDYIYIEPGKSHYSGCYEKCKDMKCYNVGKLCAQSKCVYDVVSQEYNNVVINLCDKYYVEDNTLKCARGICYGNLTSQLYSIITRTVENLVIIVNDVTVYNFLSEKRDEISKM